MPVPPEAVAVALPSEPPLHFTFTRVFEAVIIRGWVIVTEDVVEQACASVMVHTYVLAASVVAVAAAPPEGAHA